MQFEYEFILVAILDNAWAMYPQRDLKWTCL